MFDDPKICHPRDQRDLPVFQQHLHSENCHFFDDADDPTSMETNRYGKISRVYKGIGGGEGSGSDDIRV